MTTSAVLLPVFHQQDPAGVAVHKLVLQLAVLHISAAPAWETSMPPPGLPPRTRVCLLIFSLRGLNWLHSLSVLWRCPIASNTCTLGHAAGTASQGLQPQPWSHAGRHKGCHHKGFPEVCRLRRPVPCQGSHPRPAHVPCAILKPVHGSYSIDLDMHPACRGYNGFAACVPSRAPDSASQSCLQENTLRHPAACTGNVRCQATAKVSPNHEVQAVQAARWPGQRQMQTFHHQQA